MVRKKITIDVSADSQADIEKIEKALNVYKDKFTAKEHDKLRMVILYEPAIMEQLRKNLLT